MSDKIVGARLMAFAGLLLLTGCAEVTNEISSPTLARDFFPEHYRDYPEDKADVLIKEYKDCYTAIHQQFPNVDNYNNFMLPSMLYDCMKSKGYSYKPQARASQDK